MHIVLHIGLPKTATTMLQYGLHNHPQRILNVGKPAENWASWRSFGSRCPIERKEIQNRLDSYIEVSDATNTTLVISDETLSVIGSIRPLECIVEFLTRRNKTATIVLGIREQLSLVTAIYNSSPHSKIGAFGVPYLQQSKFANLQWHGSFDTWLEHLLASYKFGEDNWLNIMDYAKQATWIYGLVGRKNAIFLPYEWLRQDRQQWVETVAKALRVDTSEVEQWCDQKHNVSGERLDDMLLVGKWIQSMRRRKIGRLVRRLISRRAQATIEQRIAGKRLSRIASTTDISATRKHEFYQLFAEGNRDFAADSGIDIGGLGYLMP